MSVLVTAFVVQTALVYGDERTGPLSESARHGRALWHQHGCQVCHQLYGQGGFLGPDLTNAASRVDSVRLWSLLTLGSGQMPALRLADREIADLRAYLRSLDRPELGWGQLRLGEVVETDPWTRAERAWPPWLEGDVGAAAKPGWELFRERRCGVCHLPLASSPAGPPDLSLATQRLSPDQLRTVLAAGRAERGMPPPFPAFTSGEREEVAAFIAWLGTHRDALEEGLRSAETERGSVRWRDIPWWEYR